MILYISDIYKESNLYTSQVKNLLDLYKKDFDVKEIDISNMEYIEKDNSRLVLKHLPFIFSLPISYIFFLLNWSKIKDFIEETDIDVIVGRGPRGGLLARLIQIFFFKRAKLIIDVRGDFEDEYKKRFFKKNILLITERFLITKVDALFTVSAYLKKKFVSKYNLNSKKILISPTTVNELFKFDERKRLITRLNLGYSDGDLIFVYSGNYAWYQNVDFVIDTFSKKKNKNAKLLIISTFKTLIEEKVKSISDISIINDIKVISSSLNNVPDYLSASDFGLLIRDNIITNIASSPTKFGEYVNNGLNVVFNKIGSDYYEQSVKLDLNNIIIDKKEDLLSIFNVPPIISKNTIKINRIEQVYKTQKEFINALLKE